MVNTYFALDAFVHPYSLNKSLSVYTQTFCVLIVRLLFGTLLNLSVEMANGDVAEDN